MSDDTAPLLVCHKSPVLIKVQALFINNPVWLAWWQNKMYLMEQFISIMLHCQGGHTASWKRKRRKHREGAEKQNTMKDIKAHSASSDSKDIYVLVLYIQLYVVEKLSELSQSTTQFWFSFGFNISHRSQHMILYILMSHPVIPKSQCVFQLCINKFNLAESLSGAHYQVTELHTRNNKRANLVSYGSKENRTYDVPRSGWITRRRWALLVQTWSILCSSRLFSNIYDDWSMQRHRLFSVVQKLTCGHLFSEQHHRWVWSEVSLVDHTPQRCQGVQLSDLENKQQSPVLKLC